MTAANARIPIRILNLEASTRIAPIAAGSRLCFNAPLTPGRATMAAPQASDRPCFTVPLTRHATRMIPEDARSASSAEPAGDNNKVMTT